MSENSKLIEFHKVNKTYFLGTQKIEALKDINLIINKNDFLAIIGPSGSGKSSMLNLMSFIDEPSEGKILYGDINVENLKDKDIAQFRSNKIGIIFQNFNLIPVFSATENVALALQIQNGNNKENIEKSKELLNELGLGNHLNHKPNYLSGGQKQRVAIARALITNPEIIIADEPTSALDSKTGLEIINLMKKINETKKTTFIFSTHDPRIINQVEKTIELIDGQIKK